MKLTLDTIILFVQNVDKLKLFYTNVLQHEILEESKSEWILLKAGNGKIGLHKILDQPWIQTKVNSNLIVIQN